MQKVKTVLLLVMPALACWLFFGACSGPAKTGNYEILKEGGKDGKYMYVLYIKERIDTAQIAAIAKELKEKRDKPGEELYVSYLLTKDDKDTPWATAQYTPGLYVKIEGVDKPGHKAFADLLKASKRNVLGAWIEDDRMRFIFKSDTVYYIGTVAGDLKSIDSLKVKMSEFSFGALAFGAPYKGNEFYVIEKNGEINYSGSRGIRALEKVKL